MVTSHAAQVPAEDALAALRRQVITAVNQVRAEAAACWLPEPMQGTGAQPWRTHTEAHHASTDQTATVPHIAA